MQTKLLRGLLSVWLVLSEVPGWPDAPLAVRLRRVAPLLLALAAITALLLWKYAWREPDMAATRSAHAALLGLEEELATLHLACSDQQAQDLAAQARTAEALLLDSHEEVPALLRRLRDQMRSAGWEAKFQAYDASINEAGPVPGVQFATARATLVPVHGNPAAFASLLGVFDQISAADKRIDLTRLGVRADEPGKLEVELNLRIACRAAHEEAS